MKKKILWLMLSSLIVAALVLASCGEAVPGQQEEEEPVGQQEEEEEEEEEPVGQQEEEEEPVAGEPQYGGTITVFNSGVEMQMLEAPNPDIIYSNYSSLWWLQFMQETPTQGDIMRGPRGTNECGWQLWWYIPPEYMIGCLAKSWDIDYDELVFHVRPGIYWAPTEYQSTFMEARELTAEDLASDITVFWKSAWGARFDGMIADVYATDRYTVVVEFENYSSALLYYLGYEDRAVVEPPETRAAGANKYKNHVGTGPFMFEEYVIGSYMSFKRNPNYWDTTTINGVEYQLPFIDRVIVPIIPDESTQYAALRTGKIDHSRDTNPAYWDTLDTLTPALKKAYYNPGHGYMINFRNDQPPFDDIRVRKAMSLGIDQSEFLTLFISEGMPLDFFPFAPGHPAYTPLEELPADIQALYGYDPDEAIRLLAEAGYPDGFTTTIIIEPIPKELDMAVLLKAQWAKIGVDLELNQVDEITFVAETYPLPIPKYKGTRMGTYSSSDPLRTFITNFMMGGTGNVDQYDNPEFAALSVKADRELDVAVKTSLTREAGAILREDWPRAPLFFDAFRSYWWPWIKNYYGETSIGDDASFCPVIKYMWIDQALKEEMGYK